MKRVATVVTVLLLAARLPGEAVALDQAIRQVLANHPIAVAAGHALVARTSEARRSARWPDAALMVEVEGVARNVVEIAFGEALDRDIPHFKMLPVQIPGGLDLGGEGIARLIADAAKNHDGMKSCPVPNGKQKRHPGRVAPERNLTQAFPVSLPAAIAFFRFK